MSKKNDTVRYSAKALKAMKSKSDWAAVEATTNAKIERQAKADSGTLPKGWEKSVSLGIPGPKRGVYLRLDPDVIDWFKTHGAGYQTRINSVLRAFVHAKQMEVR
jgi:uncharacterized protein (DUF4415 family)